MTHKVGATVQVAAKQGSVFQDKTGTVTKRLTKDSCAVTIDSVPGLPPMMFGDGELLPVVGKGGTK